MPGLLDNEKLDIPCDCGRQNAVAVSALRRSPTITCACGTKIHVDASQFDREMRKVDAAVTDLEKSLSRFGN
jgi:hypothetical protein